MKRILIIRLSSLGDILLATPVARALRIRFPSAEIDWLTESRFAALLTTNPDINRVIAYDKQGADSGLPGLLRLGRKLKSAGYELILDLQHKVRSQALARLARGGRLRSFRKRSVKDLFIELLSRKPLPVKAHAVDMYLEALAELDIDGKSVPRRLIYSIPGQAEAEAKQRMASVKIKGRDNIALCPGAAHLTKRWPGASFAQLAEELAHKGATPIILGGTPDKEIIAEISNLAPESAKSLVVDIPVMAAVLARCQAVVCCDSGPLHLASAVGTPVVGIYGPTSSIRWGPTGVVHRIVELKLDCAPCSNHGGPRCPKGHHACMGDLSVETVARALRSLNG